MSLGQILQVLRLDEVGPDRYLGQNLPDSPGVVFGGQLLGQAIAAAARTVPHAGAGRSFGRADVFSADGQLVASFSQENMIRAFDADRAPATGERSKY